MVTITKENYQDYLPETLHKRFLSMASREERIVYDYRTNILEYANEGDA